MTGVLLDGAPGTGTGHLEHSPSRTGTNEINITEEFRAGEGLCTTQGMEEEEGRGTEATSGHYDVFVRPTSTSLLRCVCWMPGLSFLISSFLISPGESLVGLRPSLALVTHRNYSAEK